VVAVINGEFLLKYFIKNSSGIRLLPANKKYSPIPITEGMDFSIWGTVTKIILSV
jgi:DNA polymerase V